ncbi:MAG: DotA/TraY family protein [Gammaproteobacteria bacterium]|nr:DotA/TraY family protein [Gammaproteobacteria bacterium]
MYFLWLILLLLPGSIFADTTSGDFPMLFDVAKNDLSISYLKILFGQVGTVLLGPPNSIVQEVFTIFNLGILTLAGVLMCYTVVLSVVNTSQEGNPMGHKMSPWVVVRIVAGSTFMMPMSTGYALIQVITMWMVIQGIGFADMIWSKAVDVIASSPTGIYPTSAGENNPYEDILDSDLLKSYADKSSSTTKTMIASFFASSLCLENSYQMKVLTADEGEVVSRGDFNISVGTSTDVSSGICNQLNTICFITPDDDQPGSICGRHTPPATSDTITSQDQSTAMNAAYGTAVAINGYVQTLFSQGLSELENGQEISDVAKTFACLGGTFANSPGVSNVSYYSSCSQSVVIAGFAESYLASLGETAYVTTGSSDDSSNISDWAQESKDFGWLSAGTYYTSISASDTGTISTSGTNQRINDLLYTRNNAVSYVYQTDKTYNPQSVYKIFDKYSYSDDQGFTVVNDASNTDNTFTFMNNYYVGYASKYLKFIADDISATNMTVDSGSCTFSDNDTSIYTLDNSIKQLKNYWLKWGATQNSVDSNDPDSDSNNPFYQMNLYTRSQLSVAAAGSTIMYIATPQRSLFVLLNRALSEMLGLKYFDDFADKADDSFGDAYGLQDDNPKGGHSNWDDVDTFADACSKGLISTGGHGLYGQVLASLSGLGYQPLGQMRYMGLNLMRYGVDYFSTTIGELIEVYTRVGLAYWGLSFSFALVASAGATAVIWATASLPMPNNAGAAVASVAQMLTSVFNSGMNILYQTDQITIALWQPISAALAVTYAILGFIMGVYMANVPAIIFVFAAISFFMYVIEAMIASVLVALGLTHPEGHDLLGKAEQSIMLFLAAFIRPAAMIMGLIFSMLLMIPAFRLMNFTFIGFIGEYFNFFSNVDEGSIVPLIGAVGIAFLYAYLSMGIINNCFSLIYQIPDRLLRWLGAPTEPSMIQQMVNEVKGSVSEAAKSAGGGAESAAGSAKVSANANVAPVSEVPEKKSSGEGDGGANVNDPAT